MDTLTSRFVVFFDDFRISRTSPSCSYLHHNRHFQTCHDYSTQICLEKWDLWNSSDHENIICISWRNWHLISWHSFIWFYYYCRWIFVLLESTILLTSCLHHYHRKSTTNVCNNVVWHQFISIFFDEYSKNVAIQQLGSSKCCRLFI